MKFALQTFCVKVTDKNVETISLLMQENNVSFIKVENSSFLVIPNYIEQMYF